MRVCVCTRACTDWESHEQGTQFACPVPLPIRGEVALNPSLDRPILQFLLVAPLFPYPQSLPALLYCGLFCMYVTRGRSSQCPQSRYCSLFSARSGIESDGRAQAQGKDKGETWCVFSSCRSALLPLLESSVSVAPPPRILISTRLLRAIQEHASQFTAFPRPLHQALPPLGDRLCYGTITASWNKHLSLRCLWSWCLSQQ